MKSLILVISFIFIIDVYALQITPVKDNGYLTINITGINYKNKFLNKTIYDGLPHRIVFLGEIYLDNNILSRRSSEIYFYYDLWDEKFQTKISNKVNIKGKKKFKRLIKSFSFYQLALLNKLHKDKVYKFIFKVIVDPISEKRIKKMAEHKNEQNFSKNSKLINSNIDRRSDNLNSINTIVLKSGPRFNNIFSKILKEYSQGKKNNALWVLEQDLIFQLDEVKK